MLSSRTSRQSYHSLNQRILPNTRVGNAYFCFAIIALTSLILTRQLIFSLIAVAALASCNTAEPSKNIQLKSGEYEMQFDIGPVVIPVRLSVDQQQQWVIHNWSEHIVLNSMGLKDSIFQIDMPLFNTTLSGRILSDSTFAGYWTDHSRDSLYQIPFSGFRKPGGHADSGAASYRGSRLTYQVVFSPEVPGDCNNAIGEFYVENSSLVGTFLTESGDYRFLEGDYTGNSLHLSSFDGAHLFYFCANVTGAELTDGKFYSGKHWSEEWKGTLNNAAVLRDPDSLTFVKDEVKRFEFQVQNFDGDSITFDSAAFAGHVSIIQIFGSWCPNCTDESVFLKGLYEKYHEAGLSVIPVAFERNPDLSAARESVGKQFGQLELRYEPYYGGRSNKGRASEVFPMLNHISSYPTMIIVDKTGSVRKIHTGFYGPGTGEHYEKHCAELSDFIARLLDEKTPVVLSVNE